MTTRIGDQKGLSIVGLLAAILMALALALMSAAPASAHLCVMPDDGPGKSNTSEHIGDYAAEPPPEPEDFEDRGASMDNPGGQLAAWEAHHNSPVVDGPESCEELINNND
jgi:hypothetical protein